MSSYYKIFLNNGYNVNDPRLVQLAADLGSTPIEIWENREYWGEENAMRYLVARINKENFFCSVVGHIMQNVTNYARNYEDRFNQIADSNPALECRY
jgi:hypothetical protein